MKRLVGFFLMLVAAGGTVSADMIIDNFAPSTSLAATPLDDQRAGTRTITTSGSGTATILLDGTGGITMSGNSNFRIDFQYDFSSPFNMYDPTNRFATITADLIDTVTGTWFMQAFITNSSNVEAGFTTAHTVTTPGVRAWDRTQIATIFATDVKKLRVRLTPQTTGATITSSNSRLLTTPEPASMTLLGMTGVAGWFISRRRSKKC